MSKKNKEESISIEELEESAITQYEKDVINLMFLSSMIKDQEVIPIHLRVISQHKIGELVVSLVSLKKGGVYDKT